MTDFMRRTRILNELKKIKESPPGNCSAGPVSDDDIDHWNGTIIGPSDSPFEGGIFKVEISFPKEYPYKAPYIKFLTPIYHPNVDKNGMICLDILKGQWSPALDITKVLISLCSLLVDPNPDDPLWTEPANLIRSNPEEYARVAREWTVEHAS